LPFFHTSIGATLKAENRHHGIGAGTALNLNKWGKERGRGEEEEGAGPVGIDISTYETMGGAPFIYKSTEAQKHRSTEAHKHRST
jgi:hypothetical protein